MVTKPYSIGLFVTTYRGISIIGTSLRANQDAIYKSLMEAKIGRA